MRYHRAIRLFSSPATTYYHGSQSEFPVGFVLTPQPGGYATLPDEDIAEVEAIIERFRPTDKIPRSEAVFMVGNPDEIDQAGGYDDFVYTVEPVGKVEASDLSWYSKISVYWMDMTDDEKQQLAEGYWSGEVFTDTELLGGSKHSLIEYRARGAKVLSVDSGSDFS